MAEEDVLVYLVTTREDQCYEEIAEELGVCDSDNVLMLSSQLTEAPKKASANSGGRTGYTRKATTTLREFTPNNTDYSSNRYESRFWRESEVDLNDDTQNRLYVSWF